MGRIRVTFIAKFWPEKQLVLVSVLKYSPIKCIMVSLKDFKENSYVSSSIFNWNMLYICRYQAFKNEITKGFLSGHFSTPCWFTDNQLPFRHHGHKFNLELSIFGIIKILSWLNPWIILSYIKKSMTKHSEHVIFFWS